MCKVVIADDHPLFREAMQLAVGEAFRGEDNVVLEASSVDEVRRFASMADEIDLVLLDLNMPGMDGFAGLVGLRHSFPALPVVIVSASEERSTIREAIACGAAGFIPKSFDRSGIAEALCRVLAGEVYVPPGLGLSGGAEVEEGKHLDAARRIASLSPQQLRVLQLVAEGKPNKIIAYELGVTEATVKAHLTAILRKLGVFSRTQAVLAAQRFFSTPGQKST